MREKFICTHFVTLCIAKSAVKPIFSPLPHPTFFTPKSPFSRFSPFRTRFRAIFRGIALVFCPAKPTFFSSFLILGPTSDDFARDLTLYYRHTSLFAQREGFSDSGFPFLPHFPHLHFLTTVFPPHNHPTLFTPSPTFCLFPPHFSISLPNNKERAHPRALRAYAYTRTHSHVKRFSFIAITASPTPRNPLCTNTLGVKKNEKKPSPNTQLPHNQYINTKHPISSAVNFISSPR